MDDNIGHVDGNGCISSTKHFLGESQVINCILLSEFVTELLPEAQIAVVIMTVTDALVIGVTRAMAISMLKVVEDHFRWLSSV